MDNGQAFRLPEVFAFEEAERQRKSEPLEQTIVDLYATMRPSLLGYAYQIVGNSGEAEDLVQIAFLKLFDQLRRHAEIENVRSWLYRVIHNQAIDQLRRQGKQETAISAWIADRIQNDLVTTTEDELIQKQRIMASLGALNERERSCLLLRADGLSYKEISAVLSISVKAVSVYLARGLKKVEGKSVRAA